MEWAELLERSNGYLLLRLLAVLVLVWITKYYFDYDPTMVSETVEYAHRNMTDLLNEITSLKEIQQYILDKMASDHIELKRNITEELKGYINCQNSGCNADNCFPDWSGGPSFNKDVANSNCFESVFMFVSLLLVIACGVVIAPRVKIFNYSQSSKE